MTDFNDNYDINAFSDTDTNADSDNDSDYDDINEYELIYEAEELSNKKFTIVLCNLIPSLRYHLVIIRFKTFNLNLIKKFKSIIPYFNNPIIEISECIYLDTQECVGIIKTIWLKLIQRTWKKIYKIRKNIICMRKTPSSIFYRDINGKWPSNCVNMPSLIGMLSYLKK
jgi:hypothetical protein